MLQTEENFEEWKNKPASKYANTFGKYTNRDLQIHLVDIDERLQDIEHKINPTAKKILSTRSQQMLLLLHLGVLEKLNTFNISNKKKAKFLAVLLNASDDNIEKDLSVIALPASKLATFANYKFVNEAFRLAGITELADKTENILDAIIKLENK
ncbi:hypothetical protein QWZ08_01950 [Ferruginibacter paludis]|uniref:hypothetical protein n=1 Tax=Ferruginibacter paludis TaxID=1310417 RepID=UPI0025B46C78|nr:hypothetical protein [Ferruginibacter paludis]MDN3654369.1 hypothetical protein [Ferruginibacter paludis]